VAGSWAMALYMGILNGFENDLLDTVPAMSLWMTSVVLYTSGYAECRDTYDRLISMGCTRRTVFAGNLFLNLVLVPSSLCHFLLLDALFGNAALSSFLRPVAGGLLSLVGISQLGGALVLKYGKKLYSALGVIIVMFLVAGGLTVYFLVVEHNAALQTVLSVLTGGTPLVAGAVLCAVAYTVQYFVLRRYQVMA